MVLFIGFLGHPLFMTLKRVKYCNGWFFIEWVFFKIDSLERLNHRYARCFARMRSYRVCEIPFQLRHEASQADYPRYSPGQPVLWVPSQLETSELGNKVQSRCSRKSFLNILYFFYL